MFTQRTDSINLSVVFNEAFAIIVSLIWGLFHIMFSVLTREVSVSSDIKPFIVCLTNYVKQTSVNV